MTPQCRNVCTNCTRRSAKNSTGELWESTTRRHRQAFGWTGKLFPKGYTTRDPSRCDHYEHESAQARLSEIDCDGLRELSCPVAGLYLEAVYKAARESNVAVGGPDLMPFRPFQRANSYPLIRESAGVYRQA